MGLGFVIFGDYSCGLREWSLFIFYFCFSCLVFCLSMLIFSRWSMCMAWCGGMVAAFDSRCWGIQSHQGILFLLVVFLYLIPFFLFVWYVFFSCFFLLLISILIWVVTCNGHGQFLIFLVLAWEFGSHDFG